MICKILSRRIQKLDLSETYKQRFQQSLQSITKKYKDDLLNKALIIKKTCTKYLKICNSLLPSQPVQSTLTALEFIKSVQLDIYEGKSYQLYIIKITMHLLYVRCYDLKLQQMKNKTYTIFSKKRSLSEEQNDWRRKKYRYVERLKMFCTEAEQSYFSPLLMKDYYSNMEQLYFLCLRHEMEKVVNNFGNFQSTQISIDHTLLQTKNYINKLFELLKGHIFELNEMLFYLQKKVYQILTVKVSFMIEVFVIQAVVRFIQELQQDQNLKDEIRENEQKLLDMKEKYLSQQLQNLWQKYENVFNKIPNNVDKQEAYQKVSNVLKSWFQGTKKSGQTSNKNKQYEQKQSEIMSQKVDAMSIYVSDKIDTNKIQSSNSMQRSYKNNKIETKYQANKNQQLEDFINFVQQSQDMNKRSYSCAQNQDSKEENFPNLQRPMKKKKTVKFQTQVSQNSLQNLKTQQSQKQQIGFQYNFNKQEQLNGYQMPKLSQFKFQRKDSLEKNQTVTSKATIKDSSKRSNFGVFKDMKNVFEYIHQKNKLKNLEQRTSNMIDSNNLSKPQETQQNGIIYNVAMSLTSQGFKKLSALKAPSMNLLQKMKNTQNDRLRRIKSTDLLKTFKTSQISSKNLFVQKKKNQRSQSLYFPFIEESKTSNKKTFSQFFDLPKSIQQKNNVTFLKCPQSNKKLQSNNLSSNSIKQRQVLRLNTRSKSKKTTLDMMSFQRFKSSKGKQQNTDYHSGHFSNKFSYAGQVKQQGDNLEDQKFD